VQKPLHYYDNNLIGTITLLEVMAAHGCKKVPVLILLQQVGFPSFWAILFALQLGLVGLLCIAFVLLGVTGCWCLS
jgi:hypothetical protein